MADPNSPLGWSEDDLRIAEIFRPYSLAKTKEALSGTGRFVHYTSAATATKIIGNREIWLRQASTLNDFREIEYGTRCLRDTWREHRDRLDEVFGSIHSELPAELYDVMNDWEQPIRWQSYLACVSEHDASEDQIGRLSMWRAYGGTSGVAIVFNGAPFFSSSNPFNAFASAVAYHTPATFAADFLALIERIAANIDYLRTRGVDWVRPQVFQALHFAVLCTKHLGFREEREWRIVQSPAFGAPKNLIRAVETVAGVPQTVLKLPLKSIPSEGLFGLEPSTLVDRVIVGPSAYPVAIGEALAATMLAAGIENPTRRIAYSDIPLRQVS